MAHPVQHPKVQGFQLVPCHGQFVQGSEFLTDHWHLTEVVEGKPERAELLQVSQLFWQRCEEIPIKT